MISEHRGPVKGKKRNRLTPAQAREIVRRYVEGDESQETVGRDFGVSGTQVSRIVNGHLYRKATAAVREQYRDLLA